MSGLLHEDLTYQIRGSYFDVYNALGHNYPEHFYEKALYFDIRNKGLKCVRQEDHQIRYKEQLVGRHILDLVVEDTVIVELKVVEKLLPVHRAQLISYLKATGRQVGLLLNFGGKTAESERYVYTKEAPHTKAEMDAHYISEKALFPERSLELIRGLEEVYDHLGPGFVFRIYSNAYFHELKLRDMPFRIDKKMAVYYEDHVIGQLTFHHFLVEDKVMVFPVATGRDVDRGTIRHWLGRNGICQGIVGNFYGENLNVEFISPE
ncbi:MAG: GxxExxY protein [Candidatus Latescibacteria bacterium]|nr:GxxExxY protein [Candidatus Latescibacterota bacterium]